MAVQINGEEVETTKSKVVETSPKDSQSVAINSSKSATATKVVATKDYDQRSKEMSETQVIAMKESSTREI